jgi:nucleotide-binding universal stress UspA family protein
MRFTKILLPVDDSRHSGRAVEYAASLARDAGAAVIMVHVHPGVPRVLGEPNFGLAKQAQVDEAGELLGRHRPALEAAGVAWEERILEGSPGEVVSEAAEAEKCDLIVMGSRGRTDLGGLILGSVTHRVLHAASVPVLVVPWPGGWPVGT